MSGGYQDVQNVEGCVRIKAIGSDSESVIASGNQDIASSICGNITTRQRFVSTIEQIASIFAYLSTALVDIIDRMRARYRTITGRHFSETTRDNTLSNEFEAEGPSLGKLIRVANQAKVINHIEDQLSDDIPIDAEKEQSAMLEISEGEEEQALNLKESRHSSDLHISARKSRLKMAKYLVGKKDDVHNKKSSNSISSDDASAMRHQEIDEHLRNKRDISNDDTIFTAAEKGDLPTLMRYIIEDKGRVLESKDSNGSTALHRAAQSGHLNVVKYLVEKGADVNVKNNDGKTPTQLAIEKTHSEVMVYLTGKQVVEYEGDIFTAAGTGRLDTVKNFIENKGQSTESKDTDGWTVLHWAAQSGHLNVVKYLVEKGARTDVKNNENKTPLELATEESQPEVMKYLTGRASESSDSDIFNAAENGHLATIMGYFIEDGDTVLKDRDNNGSTALHRAAQYGQINVVRYLVEKGAKVNAKNNDNKTPLQLATERNHPEVIKYLTKKPAAAYEGDMFSAAGSGRLDLVKSFIESKKQSLESTDTDGWTVLHWAAQSGHLNVVKYLVEKGANVSAKSKDGKTSLELATAENHQEVINYLTGMKGIVYVDDLISAVRSKRLDAIKYIVEIKGQSLELKDSNGWTALHWAAHAGYLDVVEYLIARGARVDVKNNKNKTPLDLATDSGQLEVIKHLSGKEAGQNEGDIFTAAQKGQLEMVKYFIEEKKQPVDSKDSNGSTPLTWAAHHGQLDVVKYLAEKGADVNLKTNSGHTALDLAIDRSYMDVIKYLIGKKGVVYAGDVFTAAKNGHLPMVKYFIEEKNESVESKDKDGMMPIQIAASSGHLDIIKYLVEKKQQSIEDKDNDGYTALHWAADNGNEGHLDIVKYLIEERHQNIGTKDDEGNMPLHWAAGSGHLDIVKYLIGERLQPIEDKSANDWTALHWAASNGRLLIVKYLVEKGANISAISTDNKTPLSLAVDGSRTEVMKYLADKPAAGHEGDLFTAAQKGELNSVKHFVETKGNSLESRDGQGRTSLHCAAYNGHLDVVKYLVEKGADVKVINNSGHNALELAVDRSHTNVIEYLIKRQGIDIFNAAENGKLGIVKYFIEKANQGVDSKDALGWTPLHKAAYSGHLDLVKYLVNEKHADVNIKNSYNFTPLNAAVEKGHKDIIKYLIEAGANSDVRDSSNGIDIFAAAQKGQLEAIKYFLEVKKQPLDSKDSNGSTPLIWAAHHGHVDLVKYLAEKGADVNVKTNSGHTALDLAVDESHMDVIKYLIDDRHVTYSGDIFNAARRGHLAMVKYFIKVKKQDPRDGDEDSWTPLHWAASYDHFEVVKYLVEEEKVDVNAEDDEGRTPLHEAADSLDLDLVKYLVWKGARVDAVAKDGRTTPLIASLESKKGKSPVSNYLCTFYGTCVIQCNKIDSAKVCTASTTPKSRSVRSVDNDLSMVNRVSGDDIDIFDVDLSMQREHTINTSRGGHREVTRIGNQSGERTTTNEIMTSDENTPNNAQDTEIETGNIDFNGTLLSLLLLSKLPVVGKLFPKMSSASTSQMEAHPVSLAESVAYAAEVTQQFKNMLTAIQPDTFTANIDNFDWLSLTSKIARLLRQRAKPAELNRLLYADAKTLSMNNDNFVRQVQLELPKLEKLYESKFKASVIAISRPAKDVTQIITNKDNGLLPFSEAGTKTMLVTDSSIAM